METEEATLVCVSQQVGTTWINFTKCVFDGVYLAGGGSLLDVRVYKRDQGGVSFDGCEFRHCKTKGGGPLMKTTEVIHGFFKESTVETVRFQNCKGIDDNARLKTQDGTGAISKDQISRLNEDGEPYGADEAKLANSGVPGAE
jgi:hypothetical protein